MKKLLILLFAVALFAAEFDWIESYEKALKLAKKEHKPIMVMISQKNCITCQYMDDVAFENEELAEYVENNFIPLKIKLKDAPKHNLKAYGTPTFYFLNEKGEKLTRALVGGATAKVFLEKLKEIKEKYAH
ncbi:thioredoxin family protein [Nitratiruptor sp. SB155-2]|uniref:thioredoxin family protein n=1 Tax=Nitratiruptor sp. (strain SB155-2) TaxID=387092 RepID=UPI0001586FCC|nr:thioredoxin family protein [Nitratiruptor sp. SB155-2]BAF70224.1 conserved hypothetical protein [Nitratiruptor sp. SB155-2]